MGVLHRSKRQRSEPAWNRFEPSATHLAAWRAFTSQPISVRPLLESQPITLTTINKPQWQPIAPPSRVKSNQASADRVFTAKLLRIRQSLNSADSPWNCLRSFSTSQHRETVLPLLWLAINSVLLCYFIHAVRVTSSFDTLNLGLCI